jgi:hypothetical protein
MPMSGLGREEGRIVRAHMYVAHASGDQSIQPCRYYRGVSLPNICG